MEQSINPLEPKEKYYKFFCDCSTKAKIGVWADNLEEAEDFIKSGDYDECEYDDIKVDEILSYEIEG